MVKLFGKVFLWFLGISIILSLAGLLYKVILFPLFVADTAVDSAHGVVTKTLDSDNVLQNYEKFKDLYNGAKQQVMNIQNQEQALKDFKDTYGADSTKWNKNAQDQYDFLNSTLQGYKQQYERTVSDYNSDSSKLNRNLFKDKGLPAELPLDYIDWQ